MMRVDEIYVSMQGEGPRVGTPTIFARFGGCNMRCPGWPCDTQHAIDPKFRKEWAAMDAATILTECQKLRKETGAMNVCLTGGEPFLQPKQDLHELCILLNNDQFSIECFSNGSLLYPQWAEDQIMFVMDWKLPGSGEETRGLECRHRNVQYLANAFNAYHRQAVKFTIKDRNDFDHAVKAWRYWVGSTELQTFAGVVWGALDNATLAQWILDAKMPWRLNVQVHNHIWDRNQRGI